MSSAIGTRNSPAVSAAASRGPPAGTASMRERKPENAHMRVIAVTAAPEATAGERKNLRSSSGCAARRDQAISTTVAATATAKHATIGAELQPKSGPSMIQ